MEAHDGRSDDAQDHVKDNDGASKMVLVPCPSCCVHDDRGESVRWSDEALRSANVKAHVLGQDDWQKIREGVGHGRCVEEDLEKLVDPFFTMRTSTHHCESPDFDVSTTAQKLLPVERLRFRVATILVDTFDDELGFALVEKVPRRVGLVRKVDKSPVADNAQEAGHSSLNNEYPSVSISMWCDNVGVEG